MRNISNEIIEIEQWIEETKTKMSNLPKGSLMEQMECYRALNEQYKSLIFRYKLLIDVVDYDDNQAA